MTAAVDVLTTSTDTSTFCKALSPHAGFLFPQPGFFMAYDDQDDLFVDDFDFVDEDDNETVEEETPQEKTAAAEDNTEEKNEAKTGNGQRERKSARPKRRGGKRSSENKAEEEKSAETPEASEDQDATSPEEPEKPEEPAVPTDHVVHVYELGKFKRTINREFTSEDAEAFAVEYNRTSGAHSRQSVAAGRDDKPAEAL